ncbi:hypothetical protein Hanom_Chr14g01248601 [Helianthus anomalus]
MLKCVFTKLVIPTFPNDYNISKTIYKSSFNVCSVLARRLISFRIRSIFTYGQNHVNN